MLRLLPITLTALTLGALEAHAEAPRIEVAFVLDATGSMGPWIREARARVKAIAADLATGEPTPEVRFALVRYRDKGDDYVTQTVEFTPDIDAMRAALDDTRASGGGDTPEAVLEALAVGVDELAWSDDGQSLKLLYLVGDARPQHHPDGPTLDYVVGRALERGIVIHSIACGRMGGTGQSFFEAVARMSEGRPFRLADAGPKRQALAGAHSAAGATGAASLAAAVSGTARAYSDSVGVDFAGTPVAVEPLPVPAVGETGLLGAQLRVIGDAATWADLWAAHVSLSAAAPPPPEVDFSAWQVLALGGADAGLRLHQLISGEAARVAAVRPADPGVRFLRVPAATTPIVAQGGAL